MLCRKNTCHTIAMLMFMHVLHTHLHNSSTYIHAGDTAFASGFATFVTYAVEINSASEQTLSRGAQVGIAILICGVWTAMDYLRTDIQGILNNLAMFFQVTASLIIVIVVLVMAPERTNGNNVYAWGYDATNVTQIVRTMTCTSACLSRPTP
jgi:hypothetical protein